MGGARDHVRVLERAGLLPGRHEARDVRHVRQKQRAALVRGLAESGVVPVARVGRGPAHEELGSELLGRRVKSRVVHQPRLEVHAVGQGLEVDGRRAHLALVVVVAVREVPPRGEVEPHEAVVRLQEGRVRGEVGRRAAVRLHVHTPLRRVQPEGLEGPPLAKQLQLIHELVPAVVTGAGLALGVLVGHDGAEGLQDGARREVLRSDQLQPEPLPRRLLFEDRPNLRVGLAQLGVRKVCAPRARCGVSCGVGRCCG
mmetsp:Transcript_23343/g.52648  ORF Transcript_23343/g.52648 Transcript_23343/m.52648 type:complete len:256 (-) Transcript_23343:303-1070(-)